jgi:hypothetical protein
MKRMVAKGKALLMRSALYCVAVGSGDYKLLLSLLKNFAEDLNEHVYIENEIIFPRSQLLEQQLLS